MSMKALKGTYFINVKKALKSINVSNIQFQTFNFNSKWFYKKYRHRGELNSLFKTQPIPVLRVKTSM